jgi:hypothetical protein
MTMMGKGEGGHIGRITTMERSTQLLWETLPAETTAMNNKGTVISVS